MATATKNHRSLVFMLSRIEEMSLDDVRTRIGAARMSALHESTERPMFVSLLAAHEGWSTGSFTTGAGARRKARKKWGRAVISDLTAKLRAGVPVFLFHGGRARRPVGEIVAAAERWAGGVLAAEGIACISDPEVKQKIRAGELDTCSIEAEVECHGNPRDPQSSWIVDAVRKVTGVALGNSRVVRPGFPHAALLAAVEEFDEADKTGAGADAEKIAGLEARLKSKDDEVRLLSAELAAVKARDEESRRADDAAARAENILAHKNVGPAERSIILEEIKKRPPAGSDLDSTVAARVEDELKKISRLRELWAAERVAAPPEKAADPDPIRNNPLIPRTRGW